MVTLPLDVSDILLYIVAPTSLVTWRLCKRFYAREAVKWQITANEALRVAEEAQKNVMASNEEVRTANEEIRKVNARFKELTEAVERFKKRQRKRLPVEYDADVDTDITK